MIVMNELLAHSTPTTKRSSLSPRLHHLGCIVSSFVGVRAKFENAQAYEQFAASASGKKKFKSRVLTEVTPENESGAITSENDFAFYATLWLQLLADTTSPQCIEMRQTFVAMAAEGHQATAKDRPAQSGSDSDS